MVAQEHDGCGFLPEERVAHWALRVVLWGTLAAIAAFYAFADMRTIMTFVPDDTWYFSEIAENVAAGRGLTCDGINPTNGFQPLWLAMLTPLFYFGKNLSTEARAYGVLFLELALLVPAALLVARLCKMVFGSRTGLVVGVVFAYLVLLPAANGMESGILILSACLAGWYAFSRRALLTCPPASRESRRGGTGCSPSIDRAGGCLLSSAREDARPTSDRNDRSASPMEGERPREPSLRDVLRSQFILGVLLGLVMLSRLDMVFLGAAVCAAFMWPALTRRRPLRSCILACALVIAGASLLVAPYLLLNVIHFGHVTPISGTIKSTFPSIAPLGNLLRRFDTRTVLFAGLAGLFLLRGVVLEVCAALSGATAGGNGDAAAAARVGPGKEAGGSGQRLFYRRMITVFAGGILLHFLYSLLLTSWAFCFWQFILYPLFAALALAEPVHFVVARARGAAGRAAYALVTLGLIAFVAFKQFERFTSDYRDPLQCAWHAAAYEAALWARANMDPSAVLAMEHSGIFGYFTERRVVNLDGMANSYEYQDVLKDRRLKAYLRETGVGYLAQHGFAHRSEEILRGDYDSFAMAFRSHRAGVWSDELAVTPQDEIYRSAPYNDDGQDTVFLIWRLFAPAE